MRRNNIINILCLCFFICLGCEERPNPLNFEHPRDPLIPPPIPQVVARWGNHMVRLDWRVSGEENISHYRIYRKQSPNGKYSFLDSTTSQNYLDTPLQNSVENYYRISGVNLRGLEGYRSDPVIATPHQMYLVINEDDIYTHSLDVLLQLYAPPGTTVYFKVSNDSTFSLPPPNTTDWIPYSGAPYKWTLLGEGDSIKTVYGKFKNYQGQESLTISDWITYKP